MFDNLSKQSQINSEKDKLIFMVLMRLLQMINEEQFVRDKNDTIYYKDDTIPQYLNRYTDCKFEMTNHFFQWYMMNYNDEFIKKTKKVLNLSLKSVHLFLSHHANLRRFPLVKVNEDLIAHPNGYYNTCTKEFLPYNELDANIYVIFYVDTNFNKSTNEKRVTFSDRVIYYN
jgi:hypothetical protein